MGRKLLYLLFLPPSIVLAAVIWSVASKGLYYCWDSLGLMDIIPPFVHADPAESSLHDYYIAAPWIVYTTWALLVLTALWIPYYLTRWLLPAEPGPRARTDMPE